MQDEREPTEADWIALRMLGMVTRAQGLGVLRSLTRRLWITRSIVLSNVVLGAYNAALIEAAKSPWPSVFGMLLCAGGAWIALKTERDWQRMIRATRERLDDLEQAIKSIERVRHES